MKIKGNKYIRLKLIYIFVVFVLVVGFTFTTGILQKVFAANFIDKTLSYQGRLTDSGGTPVADGSHDFCFSIWDSPTGGSKLWPSGTSTVMSATTASGVFNVVIGSGADDLSTLDFTANSLLYLQVEARILAGGTCQNPTYFDVLSPRQQISASGFARAAFKVLNGTFTTALTVNTGAVTLTGNASGSTLTLGSGSSSVSGANTGDNSANSTYASDYRSSNFSAGTNYVAPSAYASANGLTMNTARLLGRTTAGSGAAEEISVAGALTLSGGVLTGTGGTSSLSGLTVATAPATLANANNPIIWNWAQTSNSQNAFTFGETSAATNGTAGNQYELAIKTLAASTAAPLQVSARGNTIIDTTNTGGITIGNTTAAQDVQFFSSSNKITSAGALTLASTITANTTGTINGLSISSGALSGISTLGMSGQLTSTLATGTAPFVVASTTPVANLNIGGNAGTATTAGTVTTAAQPNITSLGTLTGLTMGGTLAMQANGITSTGTITSGAHTITSSSANALAVGQNGTTTPAFNIDASTGTSVTGLNIKSAIAGGGLALTVTSSAGQANEGLTLDSKGTGAITIGGISTGNVNIGTSTTTKTIQIGATGTAADTIVLGNSADTALKFAKFATANTVLYVSATDGTIAATAASTGAQCLTTAGAGTAPVWGSCGASTSLPGLAKFNAAFSNIGSQIVRIENLGDSILTCNQAVPCTYGPARIGSTFGLLLTDELAQRFQQYSTGYRPIVRLANGNVAVSAGDGYVLTSGTVVNSTLLGPQESGVSLNGGSLDTFSSGAVLTITVGQQYSSVNIACVQGNAISGYTVKINGASVGTACGSGSGTATATIQNFANPQAFASQVATGSTLTLTALGATNYLYAYEGVLFCGASNTACTTGFVVDNIGAGGISSPYFASGTKTGNTDGGMVWIKAFAGQIALGVLENGENDQNAGSGPITNTQQNAQNQIVATDLIAENASVLWFGPPPFNGTAATYSALQVGAMEYCQAQGWACLNMADLFLGDQSGSLSSAFPFLAQDSGQAATPPWGVAQGLLTSSDTQHLTDCGELLVTQQFIETIFPMWKSWPVTQACSQNPLSSAISTAYTNATAGLTTIAGATANTGQLMFVAPIGQSFKTTCTGAMTVGTTGIVTFEVIASAAASNVNITLSYQTAATSVYTNVGVTALGGSGSMATSSITAASNLRWEITINGVNGATANSFAVQAHEASGTLTIPAGASCTTQMTGPQ